MHLYNGFQQRRDAIININQMKENKLRTILQFSIPSIIAMLLETVITITDGYFTEYYRIMLFCYPLMMIGTVFGMFLRVDGKPQVCMIVSIAGCILNAILDLVLVGKMELGVQGSAIGSLLVQVITVVILLGYFLSQKAGIRFRRFEFDKSINREIILNGSSEFIGEMASAISMFVFSYVLMKYVGAEGVAAFTILGFVVYELCQTISPEHPALKENTGIFTHSFDGGTYAVYHFKGFPQFLFMVYQEIFCRWLSKTGNQLDERPILDIYRMVREDGYMEIDICFPLK